MKSISKFSFFERTIFHPVCAWQAFRGVQCVVMRHDDAAALRYVTLPRAQYGIGTLYLNGVRKGKFSLEPDPARAAEWFRRAAEQGYGRAQYLLGSMYWRGTGVTQDKAQAEMWVQKAAEQGFVEATGFLGAIKYSGGAGPRDFTQALAYCRDAAKAGYADAQVNLAIFHMTGVDVEQDYRKALKWMQRAADQNYARGQYELGLMYRDGEGVDQSFATAAKWLRKAADQNYANAQFALGVLYEVGQGVPVSPQDAMKLYRQAALQGHAEAQYALGMLHRNGQAMAKNDAEAGKWLRVAAMQGQADAQYELAKMYRSGKGLPHDNTLAYQWCLIASRGSRDAKQYLDVFARALQPEQLAQAERLAHEWAPKAGVPVEEADPAKPAAPAQPTALMTALRAEADSGIISAQLQLARYYLNGTNGFAQDYMQAMLMYRRAAEKGSEAGQVALGTMYQYGEGVPRQPDQAVTWYRRSAEKGFAEGQFRLGECYREGWGVPRDYAEAEKWLRLAAKGGYADAQGYRSGMYRHANGAVMEYLFDYNKESMKALSMFSLDKDLFFVEVLEQNSTKNPVSRCFGPAWERVKDDPKVQAQVRRTATNAIEEGTSHTARYDGGRHIALYFPRRGRDAVDYAFTLDHELGHQLVHSGFLSKVDGETTEVAEAAADSFATLRCLQRFGREDGRVILIEKMGRALGKTVKEAMGAPLALVRGSVIMKILQDDKARNFAAMTPQAAIAVADEYAWRFSPHDAKARSTGPTCLMNEAQVAAALRMVAQWEESLENPGPPPAPKPTPQPVAQGGKAKVSAVLAHAPPIRPQLRVVGGTDYTGAAVAVVTFGNDKPKDPAPVLKPPSPIDVPLQPPVVETPPDPAAMKPVEQVVFDKDKPETWTKTPRNADCPCGSGKKYKYCHGAAGGDDVKDA